MINNNNVYVDNQGNFYTVLNDNDFSYFELQLLQEEGFHFVSDWFSGEEKNNLLTEIKELSLNQQLELLKKLEDNWCVLPESKFDLESYKEEYIELYECFDKDDFDYWIEEEVLPELFNDIGWYDIETICEYIMQFKKEFLFYELRGNCQGDYCMVWNNQGKNTPITQEYLESVCFDSWINVFSSNEDGDPVDNLENVPGYYISNEGEDIYLNEYMKKHYNAKLADYEITYKQ